jgi:hypothetical protein
LALDPQSRPDRIGSLAHDSQPQVLRRHSLKVKAYPVVTYLQLDLLGRETQAYAGVCGPRMVRHVI